MAIRILIVDDSPLIHNMMRKSLEKNGLEVCGDAKNGREAIELFESTRPDIVFMDITMPVMDGLEAAKYIKENNRDAYIIMLTAMGDEEIIGQAHEIGVDVFLKKPFNEEKIMQAISQIVEE